MRTRTLVILLLLAGGGYWVYKTYPSVADFVDDVTSPLMKSKAAVKESEHKRIMAEAVPPEGDDVAAPTTALREGMKTVEVKELLGKPDKVETLKENGRERLRWTYVGVRRDIVFEDGRVVSIAIR